MRPIFRLFIVSALVAACTPGVPDDLIQPKEMEKIVYDIHIADGYITTFPYQDSAQNVAAQYYKGIYKKFNIDSAKFARSLEYYYKHPDDYGDIYTRVLERMQKEKLKQEKTDKKNVVP